MTFDNVDGLFEIAQDRLLPHRGHALRIVTYGDATTSADNIAIECKRCDEVLVDFNRLDEPCVYVDDARCKL